MKHFKEKINRDVTGSLDYKGSILQQIRLVITSGSLQQYQANFEVLQGISPGKFIDYYRKDWEGDIQKWFILYERRSLFHIGNDTNNLIESHHRVIKKDLKHSHHLPQSTRILFESYHRRFMEKAHKTHIDQKMKRPMNLTADENLKHYYKLCTEFAFKLIKKQLDIFHILQSGGYIVESKAGQPDVLVVQDHRKIFHNVSVQNWSCDCNFFENFHLPCQHLFKVRSVKKLPLFCEQSVHSRYSNTTAQSIFSLDVPNQANVLAPSGGFDIRQSKLVSASDRFNYCKGVMNNICDVSSDLSQEKFKYIMNHLENFYHMILGGDFESIKKLSPSDSLDEVAGCDNEIQQGKDYIDETKVFSLDHLNLNIPKAKRRPKRKKITFKSKSKKTCSDPSKPLADLETFNLDHSYVAKDSCDVDFNIQPGTPIVLTGDDSACDVLNKSDEQESPKRSNDINSLSASSEPELLHENCSFVLDFNTKPSVPFTYSDNNYEIGRASCRERV